MLTYQVEAWHAYAKDAPPLWQEGYEDHADNKERMPLNPDVNTYLNLEAVGMLRILTVRDDGKMIGYIIFVVHRHTHHADLLCGYEDSFFLSKTYRKGLTGARMIREGVRLLKASGVQRVFFTTDEANSAGPLLERLGFQQSNTVYSMWV